MTRTAVDTSVLVPALSTWHQEHRRSLAAIADAGGHLIIPFTVLVQSFSVLTRLPPAYRLAPRAAFALLADVLKRRAEIVASSPTDAWKLLHDGIQAGAVGGGIHDYEILETALRAGAGRLLTLNRDDFLRFGDRGVEIVVP